MTARRIPAPKLIEQLTEMRRDVKSSQHAEMKASRHYRRSVPSWPPIWPRQEPH